MTAVNLLTIEELAPLIAERQVSSVELTRACLDAISTLDGDLNAFITVGDEEALSDAKAADAAIRAGEYRGPLHGIPFAIKDNIAVRQWPTTNGSSAMLDHITDYDASSVARLRDAGAVIVGKNNMHEWALGMTSAKSYFGPVHNPWAANCISGGSSGGSAVAVSAGETVAAVGTDGMGSIRLPAAMCGVVGVKPTHGLVSRWGELPPTSLSTDHVGPLTRTVTDAAIVLNALAGYDPRDPTSVRSREKDYLANLRRGVRGLRVAVAEEYFFDALDGEVERGVRAAAGILEELGAHLDTVSLRTVEYAYIAFPMILTEALPFHRPLVRDHPEAYQDKEIRYRFIGQELMLSRDMQLAMRVRNMVRREYREAMRNFDVLITPASSVPPYPIDSSSITVGRRLVDRSIPMAEHQLLTRHTFPFNVIGAPVVSMPCGFTASGLPIGVQVCGRNWEDEVVLQAAYALEEALGFGHRPPSILNG